MPLSANDVARYFLTLQDEDEGDTISNLKLQKLLYYAQGISLAANGKPIFEEAIEAWRHGPAVPGVYREYKKYGYQAIERPMDVDFSIYDAESRAVLDDVWSTYGQFSAWRLAQMTHVEPPWKQTEQGDDISLALLKEYFSTQLI